MVVKPKAKSSAEFKAKAKELLAFARTQMRLCQSAPELFMVIFGPRGKARMLFSTKGERDAFDETEEKAKIQRMIETLAASAHGAKSELLNGHRSLTLRLPKSVHAALLAEAAAEGVSLDQLCLSKLVAQLRELV